MREDKVGPTKLGMLVLVAFVLACLAGAAWYFGLPSRLSGIMGGKKTVASTVLEKRSLDRNSGEAPMTNMAPALDLPTSTRQAHNSGPTVRAHIWFWNTQAGWIFANGGSRTTAGSLMDRHGVNMFIERQDDTNILRDELYACAVELSKGKDDCTKGIHFTGLMGDQLAAQLAGWNPAFKKLGDDLTIEVIGLAGRSNGEDAFLGPPALFKDKNAAKGLTVLCAPREGDQNIVIYWATNNEIPINPDFGTYDPDAINFMASASYIDAAADFNAGKCEKRPVVHEGVRTGKTVKVCAEALTTWTPADVTATVADAKSRVGVVRIYSTQTGQNDTQMPCTIIGIKRWNRNHRETVVNMLSAILEGGDQIKAHPEALQKAMDLSVKVYDDKDKSIDAAWCMRYFRGATEHDKQGNEVKLGGSYVFGLGDNLKFFGLLSGQSNLFKASYETFGEWMHKLYPVEVPEVAPYNEVVNLDYIQAVHDRATNVTAPQVAEFDPHASIVQRNASRNWHVEFDTGKATFTAEALATLQELHTALVIANGSKVLVIGHTDNTGDPKKNDQLSEDRAFAVKNWLETKSPADFPNGRVTIQAMGQRQPLASNSTPDGRAKNRRVEIVMGQ
jgi:OOP family OmpA-OmpF porin